MSITHEAPRRGRRSNAEIAAEKRDRLAESMPSTPEEAIRERAARQAHKSQIALAEMEDVEVRVLKMGADKISMGVHVQGIGDAFYEWKERFMVKPPIAHELEAKGYVEIIGKEYDLER